MNWSKLLNKLYHTCRTHDKELELHEFVAALSKNAKELASQRAASTTNMLVQD